MPVIKKNLHPVYKKVAIAAEKGYFTTHTMQKKLSLDPKYQPAVLDVAEKIRRAHFIIGATGKPGQFVTKWGRRVIIISGSLATLRGYDAIKEIQKTKRMYEQFNKANQKANPGAKTVGLSKEVILDAIKNTEFRIAIPDITKEKPIKDYLHGPGGAMIAGGIATSIVMMLIRNKIRRAINNMRAKKAISRIS